MARIVVPHSAGTAAPSRVLPPRACDSHMHIFDPRFAPSPHWRRTPPVADVPAYRLLQQRLGTTRSVVVTPSTYGVDNRCTLAALAELGPQARGVAVVDAEVDAAELQRLHRHGIRGLRVNFFSPQSWGVTTAEMLVTLADKVAALGWHIQVLARPGTLVELAPVLRSLPVPLVIDHLGLMGSMDGTDGDAFASVRALLDGGRTWMKLSAPYIEADAGAPGREAKDAVARALLAAAPERMLWGSDWPHTVAAPGSVDDAQLVDRFRGWCANDQQMDRILVDNPAALYGFD
jgi:predicted TIM-barrel fold metal-dependent hydrolase